MSLFKGGYKNRGSVLVLVTIIVSSTLMLSLYLVSQFVAYKKQAMKSTENDLFVLALNSVIDYTIVGIKNQWCFKTDWTQDPKCSLVHQGSVERLLMSDDQLRSLALAYQATGGAAYGGTINNVRSKALWLGSFTTTNIPTTHPLYILVSLLNKFNEIVTFQISVNRIDTTASRGNEALLEIKVTMIFGTLIERIAGRNQISGVAQVLVSPREMGTNALVVANNLYLDRAAPSAFSAQGLGDSYIPPLPATSPFSPSSDMGIRFESPVYVNSSVYMPAPSTSAYTPVTFADKIILGAGLVKNVIGSSNIEASPPDGGSYANRYYSQIQSFGGFLGGVEMDPNGDSGLDVLSGLTVPVTSTSSNAEMCRRREAARLDWSISRDSQLYVRPDLVQETPLVGSEWDFTLNTGTIDRFYPVGPDAGSDPTLFVAAASGIEPPAFLVSHIDTAHGATVPSGKAVMRLAINISGWLGYGAMMASHDVQLYVDMTDHSTLTIYMDKWKTGISSVEITTAKGLDSVNFFPQENLITAKVKFLNEPYFNVGSFDAGAGYLVGKSNNQPTVDVRFIAFDAAYKYDEKTGMIDSHRTLGIPAGFYPDMPAGDPIDNATKCPTTSQGYVLDYQSFGAATYHCWSQFHWHPILEKFKTNGVVFQKSAGGSFGLLATDTPIAKTVGNYYSCSLLSSGGPNGGGRSDSDCPVFDPVQKPDYSGFSGGKIEDWSSFDLACFSPANGTDYYPSFNPATWDQSFTADTKTAWGFTENLVSEGKSGYNSGTLSFDDTNSKFDSTNGVLPKFGLAGIFETCEIQNTANFVVGFYVCNNLDIKARASADGPLRIIGTFIVGKMRIDPSVGEQGLRWSSIYHPSAIAELQAARILDARDNLSTTPEVCGALSDPAWKPFKSMEKEEHHDRCSPISLRRKAKPFKWTQVDPDCGYVGSNYQCKNRTTRVSVSEMKRFIQ